MRAGHSKLSSCSVVLVLALAAGGGTSMAEPRELSLFEKIPAAFTPGESGLWAETGPAGPGGFPTVLEAAEFPPLPGHPGPPEEIPRPAGGPVLPGDHRRHLEDKALLLKPRRNAWKSGTAEMEDMRAARKAGNKEAAPGLREQMEPQNPETDRYGLAHALMKEGYRKEARGDFQAAHEDFRKARKLFNEVARARAAVRNRHPKAWRQKIRVLHERLARLTGSSEGKRMREEKSTAAAGGEGTEPPAGPSRKGSNVPLETSPRSALPPGPGLLYEAASSGLEEAESARLRGRLAELEKALQASRQREAALRLVVRDLINELDQTPGNASGHSAASISAGPAPGSSLPPGPDPVPEAPSPFEPSPDPTGPGSGR